MTCQIKIIVEGIPVPKQSTRVVVNSGSRPHGITPARMRAWQTAVQIEAIQRMRSLEILHGDILATIQFYLPDHRRKDLDNLSKGTLDGLRGVVYDDDSQVVELHLYKYISKDNPHAVIWLAETGGK